MARIVTGTFNTREEAARASDALRGLPFVRRVALHEEPAQGVPPATDDAPGGEPGPFQTKRRLNQRGPGGTCVQPCSSNAFMGSRTAVASSGRGASAGSLSRLRNSREVAITFPLREPGAFASARNSERR